MASAFGHLVASSFLSASLSSKALPKRFWILSLISGVLPDLDSLAFKMGIPYQHPLGHRGFTHSLAFALLWSGALTLLFFNGRALKGRSSNKRVSNWMIFLLLLLSTVSHGILDAMTNGGLGVGFFIPWDNHRYFLPFRPIEVSPIKVERFFAQASRILTNEAIWIGIPCCVFFICARTLRWVARKR